MNNIQSQAVSVDFSTLISIHHNQAVTTSVQVAEVFKKQHKDVLRKIDDLLNQINDSYRQRNFKPTVVERENPSGGAPIQSRAYELTKDGFVLLAMGFTGKAATQFKIAYIDAFNQMAEMFSGSLSSSLPSNWRSLIDCAVTCSAAWRDLAPSLSQVQPRAVRDVAEFFNVLHAAAHSAAKSVGYVPSCAPSEIWRDRMYPLPTASVQMPRNGYEREMMSPLSEEQLDNIEYLIGRAVTVTGKSAPYFDKRVLLAGRARRVGEIRQQYYKEVIALLREEISGHLAANRTAAATPAAPKLTVENIAAAVIDQMRRQLARGGV